MKLRRSAALPPHWMLVIPAIQIPILLLFFFFLGNSYLLRPGISIELPRSPFLLSPQRESFIVTVPPPPSTDLFFRDEQIDWGGLRHKLSALRTRSATIIIRADRRATAEQVTRALTIALELGFPVVLATAEPAP